MQVHMLIIPDDLIEWGKQPDVAVHFCRPWAHEIEELTSEGADEPLDTCQTDLLLNRLGALCHAAIRHDRGDLLLGLDMFTAEWLGVVFEWEAVGDASPVTIGPDNHGRDKRWSYQEVRTLLASHADAEAVAFSQKVKDLVTNVFPQAQIDAIIDAAETEPEACPGCGETEATIMFTLESGANYCKKCWVDLTSEAPPIPEKSKGSRHR